MGGRHDSRLLAILLIVALPLAGLATGTAMQSDPSPGADTGLSANESATLWSRDNDSGYITNAAYLEAYGESRSAMAELANATDITFSRPPATASTWSRHAHLAFEPGNATTSVAPQGTDRVDGQVIRDAYVAVFAVTPGTYLHDAPNETTLAVPPNGTVRGIIDYRLALGNTTLANQSVGHRIDEVRLLVNETVIARTNGSHRPILEYNLTGRSAMLTLEANITAQVEGPLPRSNNTSGTNASVGNSTTSSAPSTGISEETITVRATRSVRVYRLDPLLRTVRYPDGDIGVAVAQIEPWQGYSFGEREHVRSVWRYYTASDGDWDQLIARNSTGTTTIDAPSRPVAVHAYPSEIGPQARPTGGSIDMVRTWGTRSAPPVLGTHILVDVVEQPYNTTWGIETRHETIGEQVTVSGVVRGVNTTLSVTDAEQTIRQSELSLRVLDHTDDGVRLLATLREAASGDPIFLGEYDRPPTGPITIPDREGSLTIAGQTVETNESGMAVVTVADSGAYSARYHPESWLTQDVAYTPATASTRWHPLMNPLEWLWLAVDALVWLAPLLLAVFAGRTLSRLFTGSRYS